ncbi:MAG: hypothetical protein M1383_02160 [Patescibacteria group bacterium]|nr:hypothetical protein [Patescibacteria group bacterium]
MKQEIKILRILNSPAKVQDFLNSLKINFERDGQTCMSPRRVIRERRAHCMEGAMLAAAALEFHGHKPLLVDLRAAKRDFDHVIAVFKQNNCWGAIGKTNHAVLRYREPIYKNIRELVMSFFHEYFDDQGRKNLREYSLPVNLTRFDKLNWRTAEKDLWDIPYAMDREKHFSILTPFQIKNLRLADSIEIKAGKLVQQGKG